MKLGRLHIYWNGWWPGYWHLVLRPRPYVRPELVIFWRVIVGPVEARWFPATRKESKR